MQVDPSSEAYNLEHYEMNGGEELEMIAASRKTFRGLPCSSNVRTNLEPQNDRKVLRRIVCVKPKDDIHTPGELNGQMVALKEHMKGTGYRTWYGHRKTTKRPATSPNGSERD